VLSFLLEHQKLLPTICPSIFSIIFAKQDTHIYIIITLSPSSILHRLNDFALFLCLFDIFYGTCPLLYFVHVPPLNNSVTRIVITTLFCLVMHFLDKKYLLISRRYQLHSASATTLCQRYQHHFLVRHNAMSFPYHLFIEAGRC
jgi:hypothetical protein